MIELIAKNKFEKLQFEGRCKLIIDSVSKILLVEPFNEEFKLISAMFKWEFVAQENILFIFAEHNFQDFALIFDNSEICKKVSGCLHQKGANRGNHELIQQRFLPSLFNEICKNNESSLKIKKILIQWIARHEKKDEYIQLLKCYNIYNEIFPEIENAEKRNNRKCKAKDVYFKVNSNCGNTISDACNTSDQYVSKRPSPKKRRLLLKSSPSSVVEKPNFEVVPCNFRNRSVQRLIIFMDSSRTTCYEYTVRGKVFCCCGCLRKNRWNAAKIVQRKDGTDFVKLSSTEHVCEIRTFYPKEYAGKEIVEAKNFKHFINFENGIDRSKLVIFTTSSEKGRRNCYEYYWNNYEKKFLCLGCDSKRKKRVGAEICVNSNGSQYVKLSWHSHICNPREYNPEKFEISKEKEIVESSNFKVFKYKHKGQIMSKLIIFCSTNKNMCYEYYWNKSTSVFQCCCCPWGEQVIATVCQSKDTSKEYVELSKSQEDACVIREFDADKYKDDIILNKSMYYITSTTSRKVKLKTLIIFTTEKKDMCYRFVFDQKAKYYKCSKCSTWKLIISAYIQNEGKENEIVYLRPQKHYCKALEYSALIKNFNRQIILAPNYQLVKRKICSKIVQRMVIFTNDEKTECFEYSFIVKRNYFVCLPCSSKHKISVYAKIVKNDENEECTLTVECVELSVTPHKCTPIKFIHEDITTKIIKEPNFKLYQIIYNEKNVQRLFINDPKSSKNLGYTYSYNDVRKLYVCIKCNGKNKYVTAKVFQEKKSGQSYVELGKAEHICKPFEFKSEDITPPKIVELPNFKLWVENYQNKKIQRLTIFDSINKKFGYVYSLKKDTEKYICISCNKKNKCVTAKLLQNENGLSYVQLGKTEHICEIRKL